MLWWSTRWHVMCIDTLGFLVTVKWFYLYHCSEPTRTHLRFSNERATKRKADSECRVFNKDWTTKYFFTEVRWNAVSLICLGTVAVFKEYNISRHFSAKHVSNQSVQERAATAQRLAASLQAQQNTFIRQTVIQESNTKASHLLTIKLAKTSKPFSEGEFLKDCMVETAGILYPESKNKFEKVSLSRRTVTRRVELIDEDLASKLKEKVESFKLYS